MCWLGLCCSALLHSVFLSFRCCSVYRVVVASIHLSLWLYLYELISSDLLCFFFFFFFFCFVCFVFFFFFKQKTAYEITVWLEFRRVLFRSQEQPDKHQFADACCFCVLPWGIFWGIQVSWMHRSSVKAHLKLNLVCCVPNILSIISNYRHRNSSIRDRKSVV